MHRTKGSHYQSANLVKLLNKEKGPRTVNDLKLINAGKILENNKTLSECKSPICDFSGMTTMHVVVRAPTSSKQSGKRAATKAKGFRFSSIFMLPRVT
ncbi:membrane-anchored ubiquitin-fold protein 1 isoform X4 [Zea mays]|uniref:membrane-anchored ubiquitin-fold protein 1 isoform X4 n=1 Tax=Zea mays TaxID=4577 RepID=UPI0004DEB7DA|nr:membrane-anchored ubiquitin-fold protein 1 isoform X4 [Zea mays]XP_020399762.1 membrane-anchored ubiquitin-fold protein 1 isoform X4 [Zea mays]|eukprot:XP_008660075.1 membrane-anchored ubiquitin-fold protein 1 isoform X4 [Zea mays]